MDLFGQTPTQLIQFFILYGMTGAVLLIAALYLLLRRANAFAPDVTPPLQLRRWAASFFLMVALGHVWWYLFYVCSHNLYSVDGMSPSAGYVVVVVLDCVTLLTTLAGTLFSMLQDRRRRIWPVFVAMLPFVALGVLLLVSPSRTVMLMAIAYVLLLYVFFTVYMMFAVRRYGRWLNDNYADLENKKVWLTQVVILSCLLLFMLYTLVDVNSPLLLFLMHFTELVLTVLLLWRVETLPSLTSAPSRGEEGSGYISNEESNRVENGIANVYTPLSPARGGGGDASTYIEQLLAEHCVATQLYLQHDLTLHQLAQMIGTNRSYLSLYFSRQGITYNTYINNLRINHFIRRYREAAADGQTIAARQLASESGYRSYSTFSLAFKQRTGQSVTAWIREMEG